MVLQRSTNMAGYKHVGRDMNKPRPFQVKMWRNGKQARFLAPIEPRGVYEVCGLRPTDGCIPLPSCTTAEDLVRLPPADELHPLTDY